MHLEICEHDVQSTGTSCYLGTSQAYFYLGLNPSYLAIMKRRGQFGTVESWRDLVRADEWALIVLI